VKQIKQYIHKPSFLSAVVMIALMAVVGCGELNHSPLGSGALSDSQSVTETPAGYLVFSPMMARQVAAKTVKVAAGQAFSHSVTKGFEFDENENVVAIKEKPKETNSNYALTGLYFFDNQVIKLSKELKPSKRGELEITDLINRYLQQEELNVEQFGRGFAWLDTGTYDNLLEASSFVRTIEQRQGLKIACPEEIAYYNGWLTKEQIVQIAEAYKNNNYGSYLLSILQHRMPY